MSDKKDFKSVSFRRWLYPSESSSVSAIGFYAKEVLNPENETLPPTVQTELLIHHGNKAISLHNKPGIVLNSFEEKLQNLLLFLRDFQDALRSETAFARRRLLDVNEMEYTSALYAEYNPENKEGYLHIQSCHGATRIHIIPGSPETRVAIMGLVDFVRESLDILRRDFPEYFLNPEIFSGSSDFKNRIRNEFSEAWDLTFRAKIPSDSDANKMFEAFCKEKSDGYIPALDEIANAILPVYRKLKTRKS